MQSLKKLLAAIALGLSLLLVSGCGGGSGYYYDEYDNVDVYEDYQYEPQYEPDYNDYQDYSDEEYFPEDDYYYEPEYEPDYDFYYP